MKAPCSGSQARALLPIYRGPARRAPPTSLKEPARLRHQPGACALIHLIDKMSRKRTDGPVPWLAQRLSATACEVTLGALADGAPSAPEGRHHIDTRDPVRARRRMAARMQLRAPLLRRAHSGTPSICVDSACQRPAPTAHPIQSARIRGEHRGHTELHSRSF